MSPAIVGCTMETISVVPLYSSQVSRGSRTGKIRSASCAVSSMKLLKLTVKRESCFSTCAALPEEGSRKNRIHVVQQEHALRFFAELLEEGP